MRKRKIILVGTLDDLAKLVEDMAQNEGYVIENSLSKKQSIFNNYEDKDL